MKYCSKCGNELMDETVICPRCGCPQNGYGQQNNAMSASERAKQARLAKMSWKEREPVFKKWWFWVIIGVVAIIIFAPRDTSNQVADNSSDSKTEQVDSLATSPKKEESNTPEPIKSYTHYEVVDLLDELNSNALRAEQKHQDEYVEIVGYISVIDSDGKYISVGTDKIGEILGYSLNIDSIEKAS